MSDESPPLNTAVGTRIAAFEDVPYSCSLASKRQHPTCHRRRSRPAPEYPYPNPTGWPCMRPEIRSAARTRFPRSVERLQCHPFHRRHNRPAPGYPTKAPTECGICPRGIAKQRIPETLALPPNSNIRFAIAVIIAGSGYISRACPMECRCSFPESRLTGYTRSRYRVAKLRCRICCHYRCPRMGVTPN